MSLQFQANQTERGAIVALFQKRSRRSSRIVTWASAATASLALLFGVFGVVSSASAAEETLSVNGSAYSVTVTGTVNNVCGGVGATGIQYALKGVSASDTSHEVKVLVYGEPAPGQVTQVNSTTLASGEPGYNFGGNAFLSRGVLSWAVALTVNGEQGPVEIWRGNFTCATPEPTPTPTETAHPTPEPSPSETTAPVVPPKPGKDEGVTPPVVVKPTPVTPAPEVKRPAGGTDFISEAAVASSDRQQNQSLVFFTIAAAFALVAVSGLGRTLLRRIAKSHNE